MAKSVRAWQRHKEPGLSIQLGSTPLWQTCHHRLCLHGSVHYWEPLEKIENEMQKMWCVWGTTALLYRYTGCWCVSFLNCRNLQNKFGFLSIFGAEWSLLNDQTLKKYIKAEYNIIISNLVIFIRDLDPDFQQIHRFMMLCHTCQISPDFHFPIFLNTQTCYTSQNHQ